ncbi:hypothetical protein HYH03_014919 [Edaphochlamys debaryana]|uniref:Uncharacterized protein n=1 Tax=Edaphochlamys debaryana TaxID=47281 RepID=A0A835XN95_9CHLO|nr:hypothetical protein HYH03_014919 [Edaphochlamys debaryana]|eukprot:KAG2486472.1 hypothetical protein HYH03_014919 [Edaphochlamys debaryana]
MQTCFGPSKETRLLLFKVEGLESTVKKQKDELTQLQAQLKSQEAQAQAERYAAEERIGQLRAQGQADRRTHSEQLSELQEQAEAQLRDLGTAKRQTEEELQRTKEVLREEQRQREEQERESTKQRIELQRQVEELQKQLQEHKRVADGNIASLQRKVRHEQKRSQALQKQIDNFSETMEAVSLVLSAAENDSRSSGLMSPTKEKVRSSAAHQLRQSLAQFKAKTKEDEAVIEDQGEPC